MQKLTIIPESVSQIKVLYANPLKWINKIGQARAGPRPGFRPDSVRR
jgi:hypothetical protein